MVTGVGEALRVKDAVKTALDWVAKKASRRHVDYILIFDDLERVEEGALGEIMGLVNSLITTHKRVNNHRIGTLFFLPKGTPSM